MSYRSRAAILKMVDSKKITVAQYVVDFLVSQKVDTVFLMTGGAISRVVDAMHGHPDIKYVCVQHEQSAAIAADAYSRARPESIGVTMSTSGPGFTNILTGVGCSWFDSVPSLHISGQVNTFESRGDLPVRQVGFQETDSVAMVAPISKYAVRVTEASRIRYELEAAVFYAKTGRPGPTFIDLPFDITRAEIVVADLEGFVPPAASASNSTHLSLVKGLEATLESLKNAERPLILAGGGVRNMECRAAITELATITGIPVVYSMNALAALPCDHEMHRGFIGVYGHRGANWCIANCDTLISIGSRLDSRQTGTAALTFARHAKKIVLDIDANELTHSRVQPDVTICADGKDFVCGLSDEFARLQKRPDYTTWAKQSRRFTELFKFDEGRDYIEKEQPGINPYDFYKALTRNLAEDDWVALDTGQNMVWGMQGLRLSKQQMAFTAGGMSPMGYSFPAAIGASVARGNKRAIAVIGDGGMQINIQELQTLVYLNLPVLVFVLNNRSLGLIRQFTDQNFSGRNAATNAQYGYSTPDFDSVAKAYGILGYRVDNTEDLEVVMSDLFDLSGPALVDVRIKQIADVLPKLSVNQPIECQEPALPQGTFDAEMLVPLMGQKKSDHTS